MPRVASQDYGRDETSAQALLRKHESLELEMEGYKTKVNDLKTTCQHLLASAHFDAEKIERRQVIERKTYACV